MKFFKKLSSGASGLLTHHKLLPYQGKVKQFKGDRRHFLEKIGLGALAGSISATTLPFSGCKQVPVPPELRIKIPTYESIGAKTFINCSDAYTKLSGSLMPPEVKMAMMKATEQ